MTVNNQSVEVTYVGDGSRVDFPITFDFIDPSQVHWTPEGGNVVEDGADNWIVRMDVAPADGSEVKLSRVTPITQETEYRPYDAFPAESTENALDKLTQITQELQANKADSSEIDADYVERSGDTMLEGNTGLDMNGGKITGLADAVDPTDAVSKAYMEANAVAGPQGEPGPVGPEADLTGYATETYVDDADIIAVGIANGYTDSAIAAIPTPEAGVSLDNTASWQAAQYNAQVAPTHSNAGTGSSRFNWNPETSPVVICSDAAAPTMTVFPEAPTVEGAFIAITWVSTGSQVWAWDDSVFNSKLGPPEDGGEDVTRVFVSRGGQWCDVA